MKRFTLPLLVFASGGLVGPFLYAIMPVLPEPELLYYGVGPLIWPVEVIGPIVEFIGAYSYVAIVAINILLFTLLGTAIVAAMRKRSLLVLASVLLEGGVIVMALSAVKFRYDDMIVGNGKMLIALIIALFFYALLVLLAYAVAKRTPT